MSTRRHDLSDVGRHGGRQEHIPESSALVSSGAPKPQIELDTDQSRHVDRAIALLVEHGQVFQRGGRLVEIVRGPRRLGDVIVHDRAMRIAPLEPARLRELLAGLADWLQPNR